jgi:crossover junction endodeoxyribonuclease RuvC
MPEIFLGIDPGVADTGFGVVELTGNSCRCLSYGSIKTPKNIDLGERLFIIERDLEKIISKYRPPGVAVEKLFFSKNVKTAIAVGAARGVVLLVITKNKIPLLELSPTQVKSQIAAYGKADKSQVQRMVKAILALKEIPKPDDAADALALAIAGSQLIKSLWQKNLK